MARQPRPRHITIGGREAVALTPQEYEQLIASRRQIGGQSARVRVLGQQVKRAEQLLSELETLVAVAARTCPQDREVPGSSTATCDTDEAAPADPGAGCLRCAIAALLRRHRDMAS